MKLLKIILRKSHYLQIIVNFSVFIITSSLVILMIILIVCIMSRNHMYGAVSQSSNPRNQTSKILDTNLNNVDMQIISAKIESDPPTTVDPLDTDTEHELEQKNYRSKMLKTMATSQVVLLNKDATTTTQPVYTTEVPTIKKSTTEIWTSPTTFRNYVEFSTTLKIQETEESTHETTPAYYEIFHLPKTNIDLSEGYNQNQIKYTQKFGDSMNLITENHPIHLTENKPQIKWKSLSAELRETEHLSPYKEDIINRNEIDLLQKASSEDNTVRKEVDSKNKENSNIVLQDSNNHQNSKPKLINLKFILNLRKEKLKKAQKASPNDEIRNKFTRNSKRDLNKVGLNDDLKHVIDQKYSSTQESEAEKEAKFNKALEKFMQVINVFSEMDSYVSNRLKNSIRKLARLCEEDGPFI